MSIETYKELRKEKDKQDYKFYIESLFLLFTCIVFMGIGICLLGMILAVFS
jgi:hypothetical protein